jgi:dipeptidyl aminopeptidase/acylaminoacyl peptidase
VSKHVEQCVETTATCTRVPAPKNELSVSPAWSPDGQTLAFVEASAEPEGAIGQSQVLRWYATRHLYLLPAGSGRAVEVAHTRGAAAPVWSENSRSLLFVDDDALYLIAQPGAAPVEVAGPLFSPGSWSGYFGEIAWTRQFAWSQS